VCLVPAASFAEDPLVVLAASREGRIEVFSQTLDHVGSVRVNRPIESVSANPNGRTLYISLGNSHSQECCDLYALDLDTFEMCSRIPHALFAVPSIDGRELFTQTGNTVDVVDAATFYPVSIRAAGPYNLQPSPDGRWLFGITNSPEPSLDIFDVRATELTRRLKIPTIAPATAAWAGDRFCIFSYTGAGEGRLWEARAQRRELGPAKTILLPDLHGSCNEPMLLMLAGAEDKLFLAEAFGHKVDRRAACPDRVPGGIFAIRLSTGTAMPMADSIHANRMVATPDGQDLYVIDSSSYVKYSEKRLVHISNRGTRSINLNPGEWSLSLAHIPPARLPN